MLQNFNCYWAGQRRRQQDAPKQQSVSILFKPSALYAEQAALASSASPWCWRWSCSAHTHTLVLRLSKGCALANLCYVFLKGAAVRLDHPQVWYTMNTAMNKMVGVTPPCITFDPGTILPTMGCPDTVSHAGKAYTLWPMHETGVTPAEA